MKTTITANPMGEPVGEVIRLDFDRRPMLRFRGSLLTSDAGLLGNSEHRFLSVFLVLSSLSLIIPTFAWADNDAGQQMQMPMLDDAVLSNMLAQMRSLGGLRPALADAGVDITFSYYGELLSNPVGGVRQGLIYEGRLGTLIDADLDKLVGWSGATFHASIHQINGEGLSAGFVENLMLASGIEAPATTRLFNLWAEQKIGDNATLRFGQITAGQEFFISRNANLFVNSTFGWPVIVAQDLPSGGPSYPEATPGMRLRINPNEAITIKAAIFDGNPAGPGTGNPVSRDPYGLAFRITDPPLLMTEIDYAYNRGLEGGNPNLEGSGNSILDQQSTDSAGPSPALPGIIRLGSWLHTGQFADERFDQLGLLLANPANSEPPLQHNADFGIYTSIDQMLWRAPGGAKDQGLNGFIRVSGAPGDRNMINFYTDFGLTYKGLLAGRPDDLAGIGFAYARISPQLSARDQEMVAFTGVPVPVPDYEATIELTYRAIITQNWAIQPDLQYIIHPGGNAPNPLNPATRIPNAFVAGAQTIIRF